MKYAFVVCLICLGLLLATGCEPPGLKEATALSAEGRNVEALKICEAELAKLPPAEQPNSKIVPFAAELRVKITDQVLRQADEACQGSKSIPPMNSGIRKLSENLAYDDAGGRLKARLADRQKALAALQEQAAAKARTAGEKEAAGGWAEAVRLLEEAIAINPEDSNLAAGRGGLLSRRDAAYRRAVEAAVKANDLPAAEKAIAAAKAEVPAPGDALLKELNGIASDLRARALREKIAPLTEKKRYYTAYRAIQEAGLSPAQSAELLKLVVPEGTAFYLRVGEESLKKGADGAAYLAAFKALELSPKNDAAFELFKNASDRVDKAVRVQIAIAAFDSAPKEPASGVQLSDSLIANLVKSLPYGIEILERSKIDVVLSEKGAKLQDLSKQLGVKFFVIGTVSSLEVERQRRDREATTVMKAGTRNVPNPEYQAMVARYGTKTRKWPHIPPAQISEDVTQVVKYKVGDETVTGIMMASARVFDAEKGSVTFADDFKVRDEASDTYQDAVESAHVQGKTAVLPSDTEMKDRLRRKMVTDVSKVVLSLFEGRHVRLLQVANHHIERREYDLALNSLAQAHWYCRKDARRVGEKDANVAEIDRKALLELSEQP